ncbi:MAG: DUF362 domain-containing protein [Planctomycetota bacterium]
MKPVSRASGWHAHVYPCHRRRADVPRWVLAPHWLGALAVGFVALLWLVLRSGTKPSRLTYPCQQSAFGLAAAAFGAPLVGTVVIGRESLAAVLRSGVYRVIGGLLAMLVLALWAVASMSSSSPSTILTPPADYRPDVFVVNNARGVCPGRFGGIDDLITLMGTHGLKWHRSAAMGATSGPEGLIDSDDVVIIKINGQWSERGGTNTDVLRGVIRRIVEHPDGFVGEVIVADNGQGSGNLNRPSNNAENIGQSPQDVVNDFAAEWWKVATVLWDSFRLAAVSEYSAGNLGDGYVVDPLLHPRTQIKISYPKFRTPFGSYVSYKYGVWSADTETYDSDRLVVINIPVLKTHRIYGITASVKNHMGVVTQSLGTNSHNGVEFGGLGAVMADVRMPDVTILDCIWILARPESGPDATYGQATRHDRLLAGVDPVALDAWAAKFVMIPAILENGYTLSDCHEKQDPDNPDSVFRKYLDRSMNELLLGGIVTTNDYNAVQLYQWWMDDEDRDGDVDLTDASGFVSCWSGPDGSVDPRCAAFNFDCDADVDLRDFAKFQLLFNGS